MAVSIEGFTKDLFEKYQIHQRDFTRDRSIEIDDTFFIPSERLNIYAREFNISVEDLYTKPE
ncbi:hypothetical protein WSM22_25230 [Cytophagales bacterium WSM2-2]|nr:hypothetical protein WSM22_25230 [Cytophagales bacterium WSM2-2]